MELQPHPRAPHLLAPPARHELLSSEDSYQTYWENGNDNLKGHDEFDGRLGFPLPSKAQPVEGTVYNYRKDRDDTGSEAGNMKKRQVFSAFNGVGDTRRLILHVLSPSSKGKESKKGKSKKGKKGMEGLKGLSDQLKKMNDKSLVKIAEFVRVTGLEMVQPDHFLKFPELNK